MLSSCAISHPIICDNFYVSFYHPYIFVSDTNAVYLEIPPSKGKNIKTKRSLHGASRGGCIIAQGGASAPS